MNASDEKHRDPTIWERVERYARGAEWSIEELCEELSEEGVDAEELVRTVRARIEPLLRRTSNNDEGGTDENSSGNSAPNLLSLVRGETTDTPSKIAQNLGVTVPFMKSCSDFPQAVPESCKEELIERATNVYSIERHRVKEVVERPKYLQKAASRDAPYTNKKMTFEQIVMTSGMNRDSQDFWLALAKENKR